MNVAPRYTFRKGDPCACGDPDCLCDVVITEPVKIDTTIRHAWFEMALQELGDEKPTQRNMIELAAVMLGMHRYWLRNVADLDEPGRQIQAFRQIGTFGPAAWRALPLDVQEALRSHYSCDTPWRIAKLELDGIELGKPELEAIYKFYSGSRWNVFQNDVEKSRRMEQWVPKPCEYCGEMFTTDRATTRFCKKSCRLQWVNTQRNAARKAAKKNRSAE